MLPFPMWLLQLEAMDEPWESSIVEYGAVNVTGFRIVNPTRRYVRDFLKKWTLLDPDSFPGAGRNYISVSCLFPSRKIMSARPV